MSTLWDAIKLRDKAKRCGAHPHIQRKLDEAVEIKAKVVAEAFALVGDRVKELGLQKGIKKNAND